MPFATDRGRIVRITFDIVYPTGQLKTVAMNMSDSDWGNTAIIAFGAEGIRRVLGPGLEAYLGNKAVNAPAAFDTQETGAKFKPAMLIVDNEGQVVPVCGGHESVSHAEGDNPIGRFI